MDQNKIDLFISTMNGKFPSEKIMAIRSQLETIDDNKFPYLQTLKFKDPVTFLIVSLFIGSLGIDRFMMGQIGLGVLKLITCGGCGIWTIIDWFTIMGRTREANYELLMTNAR